MTRSPQPLDRGRRNALRALATLGVGALLPGCRTQPMPQDPPSARLPTVFLPHGGGPWPFIDTSGFGPPSMWDGMRRYLTGLGALPPTQPRALLLVSAHWEAPAFTLQHAPKPPMLYDYSGFPPESYELQWPAPGAPDVAREAQTLLQAAGLPVAEDRSRGFDHGAFVPLKLAYPQANIPTFQLSLKTGLDPAEHLAAGRALAPLRDRGVFIVGSGMSYHNMRQFGAFMRRRRTTMADDSRRFDDWLEASMTQPADQRHGRLLAWDKAPKARACHPREEHLLPLMVIAGAAGDDAGSVPYRDQVMGAHVSAVHFG